MDLAAQMAHIRADAALFARVIDKGDLDAHVPSCPDWCLSDLAWHVIEVHDLFTWIVRFETLDPSGYPEPPRVPDDELVDRFNQGAEALVEALSAADPATEMWTWSHERNAGFIQRFQVQEMALHRWDAQYSVGPPDAIDPEVALDGLAVYAEFMVRPDAEGAFVVQPDGAKPVVVGGTEPVAVIGGDPSDLLLALWGRIPMAPLVTNGEPEKAFDYLDSIRFR
jgi:uncharacterized protein (TIGR03083 family)